MNNRRDLVNKPSRDLPYAENNFSMPSPPISDGRESLATTTLSFSDIQNRDSHNASGVSLGVNIGISPKGDPSAPSIAPGIGKVSGSQSSVTRSGVSEGTLTVVDAQAEQAVARQSQSKKPWRFTRRDQAQRGSGAPEEGEGCAGRGTLPVCQKSPTTARPRDAGSFGEPRLPSMQHSVLSRRLC